MMFQQADGVGESGFISNICKKYCVAKIQKRSTEYFSYVKIKKNLYFKTALRGMEKGNSGKAFCSYLNDRFQVYDQHPSQNYVLYCTYYIIHTYYQHYELCDKWKTENITTNSLLK